MVDIWLRTNRRALLFGMVLPLLGIAAGLSLIWYELPYIGSWSKVIGLALIAVCLLTILALAAQLVQPRIAYRPGFLRLFLGRSRPIEVPLDVVECFLLGQGQGEIPVAGGKQVQAANLIVKLAEKESDWAQRDVKPAIAAWCGSYVTIKGTWCEPLDVDVVKRLNRALAQANREYGKTG